MWQIVLSCNCSLYVIGRVIAGEFKQLLKAPYGLSPCRFNLMAIHPPLTGTYVYLCYKGCDWLLCW